MKIKKGIEVRIYPTKEQKEQIDHNINCYRFVYNQTLAEAKEAYEKTGHFTGVKSRTLRLVPLKDEFEWLRLADSTALQQAVRNFNSAMDDHFKNPKQFGFPKFKSRKYSEWSYRTPYNGGKACVYDSYHIKVPKIELISSRYINLPKDYKLLNITIKKTKTFKYYAKLCIECEVEALPKTGKVAGFDLGLEHLLICSDGSKIEAPKFARNCKDDLAKAQRKLSKMRTKLLKENKDLEQCKNYQKQKKRVAKLQEHIANQRKDFNHKLSKKLVGEYDLLAFEDLNVKGTLRNHHLAYSISDVSWSQLLRFIGYKCKWYDKQFIQVPRFYPSSKTCSVCGCYHKDIVNSLSVREWICPDCGTSHDRDINAAKNILNYALGLA